MRTLGLDVKYALRSNLQRPWLTGLIVLTLALGLGANAAVLAMVDALIVRPFPFPDVDRIVLLLRQRLEERERLQTRSDRRRPAKGTPAAGGIGALTAIEGIDEKTLRRAFIQTLLADQLGKGLINDAQFQQVVDRVTDAIDADPSTARLLSRLLGELRTRGSLPKGASPA